MGLFSFFNGFTENDNYKTNNVSDYSDEELNMYGLTEEEKKLVRSGENNPWDFDEDRDSDEDYSKDEWNN